MSTKRALREVAATAVEEKKPIRTALTLKDRDQIDTAKGRALRLVRTVATLINPLEDAAILDLLDVILEDLTMINAVFAAADARREQTDGAR